MKIRSVRPEFFSDPNIAVLSFGARLLYIGLWCHADDEGRGEFLPKRIEGDVFPVDNVDFDALWAELEQCGRTARYTVKGQEYFYIPTFEKHQRPNRKYESKHPAPPSRTADALPTHDASTADAHAVAVAVEGEVAVAFQQFNDDRAAAEFLKRGKTTFNPRGYTKKIAEDPQFIAESRRLFPHKDCKRCGGAGFYDSDYSPGSGVKRIKCEEPK